MMHRMGMRLGILWVGAALAGAAWAKAERLPADPYGVCCHITRNWAGEWTDRDVLFREMKRAGISWIRADIDADSAMPKKGQFNDDYIRRALAPSEAGLNFLPILPGRGVSDIAWPWHGGQKLENYAGYVRHCAAPAVACDIVGKPVGVPDFARPIKLTTMPFYLLGGEVAFEGK